MPVKLGIIAALVISVFLMMQGISTTWKDRSLPEIDLPQAKDTGEVRGQLEPPVLQPKAPAAIPDLKSGYLFNEDRQLATPEEKGPEMPVAETEVGIEADIESLTYQGSIIGETFRRAIVSYTAPPEEPAPAAAATTGRRPTLRRGRQARMPTRAAQGNVEQSQVEPGDLIAGYKVAAIFPDKIVFEKEDELLEKFIYDPSKERKAPVRSAEPRSAVPPRPMSTSVGVPSAPAPPPPVATTSAGRAEASPAESRSSGITVSSPGSSSASSASAPAPVPQPPRQTTRRLIVSRKAPPKPDTSRVIRGGRRTTTTTPMPPGVHR